MSTSLNINNSSPAFTVLDVFSGAGGLSLGFVQAGFNVVCAIDNNPVALNTYANNIAKHTVQMDLSTETKLPATTVIVGGPPCQGFSSAGLRKEGDARNSLVGRFAEIVAHLKPHAFVFENVEGFLTAEGGARVIELLSPLIRTGYRIHLRKVNAANFGVPQHRKRVIAIGGLGWNPSFPQVTHSAFGAPGAQLAGDHLPRTPTLMETLQGLPKATKAPPGVLQGHFYAPLVGIDLQRAAMLKPGQTMRDLPEELRHESYRRRAFRRVIDGTPSERRGGAPTGIRRLAPNEPSKAITGGARAEFLHPKANRPLTIRECARLQTFPDKFEFFGSASDQIQLIGNAVPPLLAFVIAKSLAQDLVAMTKMEQSGALLSFVPTLSNGFSPLLKQVTEMVTREFMYTRCPEQLPIWA